MSEVRRDIVTDTWVIIDTENDVLPQNVPEQPSKQSDCPFCEGNEQRTPNEIFAIRDGSSADQPGWRVRVIPNIYPILQVEGDLIKTGVGVYDMVSGIGANEVIIEAPAHTPHFFGLSDEQVRYVLKTYRIRIEDLHKDKRLRYILIFKNHGSAAGGSSIDHPHTDLIALPATPIRVKQKLSGAREYFSYKERCLFCDIIQQEVEMADRLVFQSDHFAVITPFASRFPFELLVIPRRHQFSYTLIDQDQIEDLAVVLKRVFRVMNTTLNDPSYNLVLNDSPNLIPRQNYWTTITDDFHWHIEIIPRMDRRTGFELGTGFHINRFAPERAASALRENL